MGIFLLYKKTQNQIALLQQKFADFTGDEKKFNRTPRLTFFFIRIKYVIFKFMEEIGSQNARSHFFVF